MRLKRPDRATLRKILSWIAAGAAVYTLAGFLVLPRAARPILERKLSDALGRQVAVREIQVNPFVLAVKIIGLSVRERGGAGNVLAFEHLYLNVELASLFRGGPVLRDIILKSPRLALVRHEDLSYNVSDILDAFGGKPSGGKPLRYSLNNIQVVDGSIDFADEPKQARHTVRELRIAVPFLSNLPYYVDVHVQPVFMANINGTAVALRGRTKPFSDSRETSFDIDIRDFDLPHYLEYLPLKEGFRVPSGALDVEGTLSFIESRNGPPVLSFAGKAALRGLLVQDGRGGPILSLPLLSVPVTASDVFSRKLSLGNVLVRSPELSLARDEGGTLNVQRLFPGPGADPPREKTLETPASRPGAPFVVEAAELRLTGGKVFFSDRTTAKPFRTAVDSLDVTVRHFSNAPGKAFAVEVSLATEAGGTLAARGTLGMEPLAADLAIAADGVAIVPFQPYFADKVTIVCTGGRVSAKGRLVLGVLPEREDRPLTAEFRGEAFLARLSTVDRENAEDFLKWHSLHLGAIHAGCNPLFVEIGEVALADFYSRLVVNPDGSLNVQGLVESGTAGAGQNGAFGPDAAAAAPKAEGPKEPPVPVRIDRVTLQGGRIDFSDRHIKPGFSAALEGIGGRVSGLSSDESRLADVSLKGRLAGHAPLVIAGKINPLARDLYVDLKVDFRDIDLSPLTPYSGRYAGYTVEKGKLSLGLAYHIVKKKLDAGNRVFIDQFAFGDQVDSPDATKLPVRLAVALLKDRNGEIRLDLPVSGTLDDPRFRVWQVILKIVTNILVKAATSPFALLGAAFGGGEELSYVEFEPGQAALDGPGETKLASLAKALGDRPALKLEIAGRVDAERDGESLRRAAFERKIRAQKLVEQARRGAAASLDNVVVLPAEYPKYLRMAYRKEKFPKPRNILGIAKDLPVPEMEKLILTHIRVTDDDLRLLSLARAQEVRRFLVEKGAIAPERIFLTEAGKPAERKEKARDSRADFVLR